jgi:hypothetical protein
MKPEIKQKWLSNLRSGEYEQAQGFLRTTYGYCCLGVLCDLYSQELNVPWTDHGGKNFCDYDFLGEPSALPIEVVKWAGLKDQYPKVKDEKNIQLQLTELNDNGTDFKTIANLIEKSL